MYKDTEIQKLIDNLDIVQVIGEYVTLKKAGVNYKGFSPFKDEKTPSFVVSPVKNIFKDFSTGIGGNAISFYMKINNISFYEAVEELSRKYNVSIKKLNINKNIDNPNTKYYEIMREAQTFFKNNIINSEEALKYMENRGYSREEIQKFDIGFSFNSWDSLLKHLKEKGYNESDLLELGLIRKNDEGNVFDYFRNRIMFPIYNDTMKLIGFGGRTVENNSDIPKYLNSPDSKIFKKGKELYGLSNRGENIKKKGLAILMEGYLDVLTAQKNGFINSVASLGTAFTEEQAQLLKKYTNNVIIAYDNDEAGKNAIIKAGNILKKQDFNVRCLSIEGKEKDPDEYLRKHGRKDFLEILKTSKNYFDFLYDYYSEDLNLNEISGKKEFIQKFKGFFSNVINKTERNLYINKLSVELGIDKDILSEEFVMKKKDFSDRNPIRKKRHETVATKKTKEELNDLLEKETLEFILRYRENGNSEYRKYCEKLESKNFTNIIYGEILEKLKKIEFDMKNLNNSIFEEEETEMITTMILNANTQPVNAEKEYKDHFKGWFDRELNNALDLTDKKDVLYKTKLQRIKTDLKSRYDINEIEKEYEEFKLIRRSDYV
ncbi:DNA primase [Pseudoleptotrichia goodfellowii]|uniref:DNA primase n=1 Tax=Pseudoleptotrichia goodfellowii TaxID=157692 RepID=A0A510JBM1_9FUSO|nr:DNA primase [Pseudoleptotrichia goodfellowii]BBM36719.1 DNA primase [Pseudoleptotrichia goodfellowii]